MSDNQVKIKKQTIDPTLTLEDVKKQLIDKGKKKVILAMKKLLKSYKISTWIQIKWMISLTN